MTPLQMAAKYCSNHRPEGCQGLDFKIEGGQVRIVRFKPEGTKCVLGSKSERCPFFESAVMGTRIDPKWPNAAQQVESAVRTYRLTRNVGIPTFRKCEECGCEVAPRQHRCDACKAKHRRDQIAAAVQKHRNRGLM